ncbi:sporulation histidine kinase inhibitor Sda [Paenibacillus sp. LMG 31456]|uniref:Sporulation histidine kinase inhibitor Sda n=1 Tax=Paenibacillus foliorum TaxID=2654974 RepID=A0A972K0G0_9BACL|nr:sporulation histidine kinase inhibitor Sda [Paenibacillus foliorum]NOU95574.1 sporulation histidine kinase inhibitor Sda [Paenibacillus foliorum]
MILNDKELLASYKRALELQLEQAFITLLEKELVKRGIAFTRPSEDDSKES